MLGSWTQLRHDTILYVRPSGAQCGGDGEIPPPPPGYVMTDEAWLEQVKAHRTPPQPDWTGSFYTGDKAKVIEPAQKIDVPCGGNGTGGRDPG